MERPAQRRGTNLQLPFASLFQLETREARLPHDTYSSPASWRPLWTLAGLLALGVGIVGIFLPVLPTTPLVLLAAFCFSKGSPMLRRWITGHRTFGPMIADWEATGAIPRMVKYTACGVMLVTFLVCLAMGLPVWVLMAQGTLMLIGAAFVLTRPDR